MKSGRGRQSLVTLEEKDEKPLSSYRPPPVTIAMFLMAFLLTGFVSWRAVETANAGRQAARSDLSDAEVEIAGLQDQLNCTIKVLTRASRGMLDNSILQDDVLLASTSGANIDQVAKSLEETRARLITLNGEITKADEECTK